MTRLIVKLKTSIKTDQTISTATQNFYKFAVISLCYSGYSYSINKGNGHDAVTSRGLRLIQVYFTIAP